MNFYKCLNTLQHPVPKSYSHLHRCMLAVQAVNVDLPSPGRIPPGARDLRMSLVRCLAQSTFSPRISPGCSGLDPFRSKPFEAGDCTDTLGNCSTPPSSRREKFFLTSSLNCSFQVLPISHPPATHCCEETCSSSLITSVSVWAGCSQALLRPFLQADKPRSQP